MKYIKYWYPLLVLFGAYQIYSGEIDLDVAVVAILLGLIINSFYEKIQNRVLVSSQ